MQNFLIGLANNNILWNALTAWLVAGILKIIFNGFKQKKINLRRFFGTGGMPSSHSALVSALATSIGVKQGWDHPITALALIFAMVVMYDAAGVRLAASKQAAVLNKMIDELFEEGEFHQERLKELLGHTRVEVIVGSTLGVLIALVLR